MTPVPHPCSDPAHAELAAELATLRHKLADAERRVLEAERRVLEKDELYNSLVDAMAEGVALQEPDGTIAACNQNALKILGPSLDQFLGQTSVGLEYRTLREDGSPFPGLEHPALVTLRTGQPCLNVTMGICKEDGSMVWILINSMPVRRGASGRERCCVVTTFHDITELKQAAEKLSRSESDLREAQQYASMGSWTKSLAGELTWSPELYRMFGREPHLAPIPVEQCGPIFSSDSFAVLWPAVDLLLGRNKPFELDVQLANGHTWLTARGEAELDAAGRVTRWHGIMQDITVRKAEEARLAQYTAELDYIYNNAPCGYQSLDQNGTILQINDTELEMLGYTREEVVGKKTFFDIATEASWTRFAEYFARMVGTGRRETFEAEFQRKDGSLLQVLVHAAVSRDAEGRYFSRAAVVDISRQHGLELQRLKAEAALQESGQRLQLALDAAELGVWELDLINDTSIRNLRHDQIFGYQTILPEWTVATFLRHVVTSDRDAIRKMLDEGRTAGGISFECRIMWPDQSIHWISGEGKAARDASGKPVRMLGTVANITERKRAEAELLESEARYRAVVEDQAEFIARFLPDGTITFMNASFLRFFGLGGNWVGKKWKSVAVPEDLPQVLAALASVSPEFPVVSVENRVLAADGQIRWAHFVNRAFFDSSGEIIEFQTVGRDITERKAAEVALLESEAAFRQLADAMPQIAWICDGAGRMIYTNQRSADYTGLAQGADAGNNWSHSMYADDLPAAAEAWNRAVTTGGPYQVQGRLRSAAGDYRWFLVRGVPVRDGDGKITKWFGTCTDIHDLMEAEAELRLLNEQLHLASSYNRSLLEASLDPLVTIGPNGRITDVNEATEKATGRGRQELIGSDFSEYFTDPDRARATYEAAFREGLVRDYPLELRHRDGTVLSVVYNASVYRGADGRPAGVFAAARDVTGRRRAEQELQVHRCQLEENVVALRNSLADKEVLLKEVHHRVKNNLQIVSSLLHMQARVTEDPAARELLRESENRVQSMGAIHENLYRASDLSQVVLAKYLGRVVERVMDTYRQSGVTCVVEGDNEITATAEIAMPCGLIVNELLSNVLKHAFQGGPGRVAVTVHQAGGYLTVAVQDNGHGLPDNFGPEMPRGLGLQLVRALTDQVRGTLRIVRGPGTRFELEIPTAPASEGPAPPNPTGNLK